MDKFTNRSEEVVMNNDRVQLNVDGNEPEANIPIFLNSWNKRTVQETSLFVFTAKL